MRLSEPGLSEADLAAHFEYICARGGSQRPAYVPVVASGCVIALLSKLSHLLTSVVYIQRKRTHYPLYAKRPYSSRRRTRLSRRGLRVQVSNYHCKLT